MKPCLKIKVEKPNMGAHSSIPALGRQRPTSLCEFKTGLFYITNSWPYMAT